MRIAIDGTALYGKFGGVQYAVWNLLRALDAASPPVQYVVYLVKDGPTDIVCSEFSERWKWRRLPFSGEQKLRRIWWQQRQLSRQLEKDQCDLLFAPAYLSAVKTRVPKVLFVYDLIALQHPQFVTRSNWLHYRLLLGRSLRSAARIAVPSELVKQDIGRLFGQKVLLRTSVIPLGIEEAFLGCSSRAQNAEIRDHYNLPQKYFLYVGNREPKKNLENLERAHRILQQNGSSIPLAMTSGARPWPGKSTFGDTNILDIGYVPREDLPVIYAASVGLVFPTLAEGFGLPVLEALACGTPVITTSHVPIADIEKVTLIVDPHSPQDIAKAMQQLLDNPQIALAAQKKGPVFAASYTWEAAAQRTIALLKEAADAPLP